MRNQARRRFCRVCERPRDEEGGEFFSARGLCRECSTSAVIANMDAGGRAIGGDEWWRRWRVGMARSVGVQLDEEAAGDP